MAARAAGGNATAEERARLPLARGIARYLVLAAMFLLTAASLLPLAETRAWWVRVLDFPTLQFLVLLACLLAAHLALQRPRTAPAWFALVPVGAALAYGVWRLHPYVPIVGEPAIAAAGCPEGMRLRVLIANVQEGNRRADRLLAIVRDVDPDLFLAMETDAWWDGRLAGLRDRLPHGVRHVPHTHTGSTGCTCSPGTNWSRRG